MKQKAYRIPPIARRNPIAGFFTGFTGSHSNSRTLVLFSNMVETIFLIMLLLQFPVLQLTGQTVEPAFDTIRLERSDNNAGFNYVVSNFTAKEIGYHKSKFEKTKGCHFPVGKEISRGLFTLVTGVSTDATMELDWLMTGIIRTDNQLLNWKIDIYCPGSITKTTERVRNPDGSVSNETYKDMQFYWEQSLGLIICQSDTIGSFVVVMDPRHVHELDKWTSIIFAPPTENGNKMTKERKNRIINDLDDFALWGDLYGKEMMVFYHGEKNQLYLFAETELSGLLQADLRNSLIRKKNRIKPSLMVKNNLSQQTQSEVLLLSMLGQWFKDSWMAP